MADEDRDTKIAMFQNDTGEDDIEKAISSLEVAHWDVNLAASNWDPGNFYISDYSNYF